MSPFKITFRRKSKTIRPTTVNDFLSEDDVTAVIDNLKEKQPNMKSVSALWYDRNGDLRWHTSSNMEQKDLIYALRIIEADELKDDKE